MPIYEYECEQCSQVEEILQKFSDKPLLKCKNCSGRLHRLISQNSFHLKGSGWYVTDYTGRNKNKSDASENTSKPNDASKTDTKTATKAAGTEK
jgi:putative FmdB family regulatory protein